MVTVPETGYRTRLTVRPRPTQAADTSLAHRGHRRYGHLEPLDFWAAGEVVEGLRRLDARRASYRL